MPLALAYIMVMCTAIYLVERVLGITEPGAGLADPLRAQPGDRRSWSSGCSTAACSSGAPATGNRFSRRAALAPRWRADGDRRQGHEAPGAAGQLRPGHAQGDGAHLQAHVREEGDDAVPGAEEHRPGPRHGRVRALDPRWRGTHRMLTDEQGRSKCVACGLCPQICPANCIKLVPGEDEQGNRYPLIYEIDEFRCIFCGYCQEVCPEEAIHVGVHFENSEYSRGRFVYDLERLSSQTHAGLDAVGPVRPQGRVDDRSGLLRLRGRARWSPPRSASCPAAPCRRSSGSPRRCSRWRRSTSCSSAQFVAAIQVLVYAGAVMVLFLFVIMLLNLGHADHRHARARRRSPPRS